ncbi:TPA: hypothetical protein ACVU5C_003775 [Vibrio parahaemolyticus]|nr:hypothetical protein [Vibrio parahaemolyticus]HBC3519673.1 hypothetical protein [Vibrio parahaemolyticus]HBC3831220.1 hypothetical protein [Vibrio parahaemolyticus]
MPKNKKSRKQKSKAKSRSHSSPSMTVSEETLATIIKIKKLNMTRDIDIVRPKVGGRYQGTEKGLFCSNEPFLFVLKCSERDEHGDFQVECYDEIDRHFILNAYDWAFKQILIGNEGEYTMMSIL